MSRRRKILYGVTTIAMAFVLLFPMTGWLVRQQVRMLAGLGDSTKTAQSSEGSAMVVVTLPRDEGQTVTAQSFPDNFELQLADAVQQNSSASVPALRDLRTRFQNPVADAALIRYLSLGAVLMYRNDEFTDFDNNKSVGVRQPRPEIVARAQEMDQVARAGASRDPANAFFPQMEAVALYSQRRDSEALDALRRAASCTTFDDYVTDEGRARIALREKTYGDTNTVQRMSIISAIWFPHYTDLRASARQTLMQAVALERSGRKDEAYQIRYLLFQTGVRQQRQAKSMIGSLVGRAIAAIAFSRPNGSPKLSTGGKSKAQIVAQRVAEQTAYLKSGGHEETMVLVRQSQADGDTLSRMWDSIEGRSVFSLWKIAVLGIGWQATVAFFANALSLLLCAGIAALLLRHNNRWYQAAWLCAGILVLQVVPMAMTHMFVRQGVGAGSFLGGDSLGLLFKPYLIASLLSTILPVVLLISLWWASKAAGVERIQGVARGVRGLAPLLACVLLLTYAAVVIPLAQCENGMKRDVVKLLDNEIGYMRSLAK